MSETTSPSATILPKALPRSRPRLDAHLAEASYPLVGIPRLPRRPHDVPMHVRDVARHHARLPVALGDHLDRSERGRQDAALRPPEYLLPAPVLHQPVPLPYVREPREAVRPGRDGARRGKGP